MTEPTPPSVARPEVPDAAAPAGTETQDIRGAATVFSDFVSVLGGRFGSVVLSLLSVVITTRILSPSGYGVVAYATVVAMLLFTVTSAWTSTAVSRYGREALESQGSMTVVTWNRAVITAPLISVGTAVVVGLKLFGALPAAFTWGLVALAVLAGILSIAAEHLVILLEAAGRMKTSALALLVRQGLTVAAYLVILITGYGKTPATIVALSIVATALGTIAFSAAVWRNGIWPPALDRDLLRRMLKFSAPLIAFTMSQYVVRSIDLFVIGAYRPTTDVGVYAVAYQGYSVLQALAGATPPLLTPLFVSVRLAGREALLERFTGRTVSQLTFIAAVLSALAVPFVRLVVPVVFGSKFEGAARPLEILMVALVLFATANLLAPVIVLHERTAAAGLISVVSAVVNVVGDVVLIGPVGMGLEGAAVATTLSVIVLTMGYLRVVADCTGTPARLSPFALLPLIAALVPTLAFSSAGGAAVGLGAGVLSTVLVLRLGHPFEAQDIDLLSKLDMPAPLKRVVLRALARVAA